MPDRPLMTLLLQWTWLMTGHCVNDDLIIIGVKWLTHYWQLTVEDGQWQYWTCEDGQYCDSNDPAMTQYYLLNSLLQLIVDWYWLCVVISNWSIVIVDDYCYWLLVLFWWYVLLLLLVLLTSCIINWLLLFIVVRRISDQLKKGVLLTDIQ